MGAIDLGAEGDLERGHYYCSGIAGLCRLDTGLDPAVGHPGGSKSKQQCDGKHGKYSAFYHDVLLVQLRMIVINA
jgi:hypothetical protein